MNVPRVSLGQSHLQDALFVVGAQLSGFRKLRQIELEIRSLEDAIKQNEFSMRKNSVKLKTLGDSELEQIEREEIEWANMRASELLADATSRLDQFLLMRTQCIAEQSPEYWARGFEAEEVNYWPAYFGKKMALEIAATGQPSMQTAEQITLLPDDMKMATLNCMQTELPKLVGPEKAVKLLS